ncbi:hypothetical protein J6590_014270 [Homalodisca vitripennis]|nr:hypothetical protein J6590_014270 [Homalodisca vitripennis]
MKLHATFTTYKLTSGIWSPHLSEEIHKNSTAKTLKTNSSTSETPTKVLSLVTQQLAILVI